MVTRLERLRRVLQEKGLPGLIVTQPLNVAYLSEFAEGGTALVTDSAAFLIVDKLNELQAKKEARGFLVVVRETGERLTDILGKLIEEAKLEKVGFEAQGVSVQFYGELKKSVSARRLKASKGIIEELRQIKDSDELRFIRKAAQIAEAAFKHILGFIRVGVREREVAMELEYYMRKAGSDGAGFDTIVASGKRSAMPHAKASDKKLKEGEFIKLDFGAKYKGYCSDLTRTVLLGKASGRQREVYGTVLEAETKAIKAIKPGLKCGEVDAVSRNYIASRGYGEYFVHSLGHGVGMAVHEGPGLRKDDETVLKPGMVLTVEPGIYIPNWGGVRIEDMVVVTETGCQVLTKAKKELIML